MNQRSRQFSIDTVLQIDYSALADEIDDAEWFSKMMIHGFDAAEIVQGSEPNLGSQACRSKPTQYAQPHLIGRLAGLPSSAVEPLTSPVCSSLALELQASTHRLAAVRAELVAKIEKDLSQFDVAARRFLLTVKRACFNGRSIGPMRKAADWHLVEKLAPSQAEEVLDLEERLLANESTFATAYSQELERERRHVASQARDIRFLRGVALGRPGLVQKIRQRAPALVAAARLGPVAKWERSLLRFVTRAATKMSANSTLTVCCFGAIAGSPDAEALCFESGQAKEHSLVRANRPELEQFLSLLATLPAIRESWLVSYNSTVEETEPGRYRFLRNDHWEFDAEQSSFRYCKKARVVVRLDQQRIALIRRLLGDRSVLYSELVTLLAGHTSSIEGEGTDSREIVDQLIRLGLAHLFPPWPTHEPRLEQRILSLLRRHATDPTVAAALKPWEEFVSLQLGYAGTDTPETSVQRIAEEFGRAIEAVLPPDMQRQALEPRVQLFEEVLVVADDVGSPSPVLFSMRESVVREIQSVAGMVTRFASLFNHRHDIMGTLVAWWRTHAPNQSCLSFVELSQRFAPVWTGFLEFVRKTDEPSSNTWNPLDSAALHDLRAFRVAFLEAYSDLLSASQTKDRLAHEDLKRLVERVPARYAPLLGASAFVQPADALGETWVFNNIHEGTGRYLSRITPALEGSLEQSLLDHLISRSLIRLNGESAELLEVKYPWGHLVRAHHPQTARVLDFRGSHLDLPVSRKVRLQDLQVEFDFQHEGLRLLDGEGRRLLPFQVSTLNEEMLPNFLRILLAFGPGEVRSVFPFSFAERVDDTIHLRRLSCGSLILRREAWTFDIEALRSQVVSMDDQRSYVAIDAWRRGLGLPSRVFYYEPTLHAAKGSLKPQFLDFSSPVLVGLFTESVRRFENPQMMIEEAIPAPDQYPLGLNAQSRGAEFLVDHLMLSPPGNEVCIQS